MSEAQSQPCRVVAVEWDRGHEEIDGILRAEGPDGIILTEVDDLIPDAGYVWLRANEVLGIEDYCETAGQARTATLREVRSERLDSHLTELVNLAAFVAKAQATVGVYQRRTGSGELLAGVATKGTATQLTFRDVDSSGILTGDEIVVDLDDIIRLDWDTDYLRALRAILEFAAQPDH